MYHDQSLIIKFHKLNSLLRGICCIVSIKYNALNYQYICAKYLILIILLCHFHLSVKDADRHTHTYTYTCILLLIGSINKDFANTEVVKC